MELFPIRCGIGGCNRLLAHKQNDYEKLIRQGYPIREALDILDIKTVCCRTSVMNPQVYVDRPAATYYRTSDTGGGMSGGGMSGGDMPEPMEVSYNVPQVEKLKNIQPQPAEVKMDTFPRVYFAR